MRTTESDCVGCGLPCMGSSCPHNSVTVYRCDWCDSTNVEYIIDDDLELCKKCAEKYMIETATYDYSVSELGELFKIKVELVDT